MQPFPPTEPFRSGLLPLPDGQRLHWEASGHPQGQPLLYLHGGPGGGLKTGHRRHADPTRFMTVAFDQRGCGRSRPWATEASGGLERQTTAQLIADIEALRAHLGVARWLLVGVSWGTTLGLAYAQAHPERVAGLVLAAMHTPTPEVVAWMTEGLRLLFPIEWAAFSKAVPIQPGQRLVDAYLAALSGPDAAARALAAQAWCAWEDTHVSLDPALRPNPDFQDPAYALNFATLVAHFWAHGAFLAPGQLVTGMPRIAHLPGALIHGRWDVSSPLACAWDLHQAWPGSDFVVVEGEGHGGPRLFEAVRVAIARMGSAV